MTTHNHIFNSAAVTIVTAALLLCSCGGRTAEEYSPLPGDLLFTLSGTSEMSWAISSATSHKTGADSGHEDRIDGIEDEDPHPDDFDHVGIFAFIDGKPAVIEAAPKKGAVATPLDEFMARAREDGGGIVVKRLRANCTSGKEASAPKQRNIKIDSEIDLDECVQRAEEMLGLPYDWSYLPGNGKIYCSELVYESFVDRGGRHIFKARPMNFRDREGNLPEFWSDLFAKLGEPIPEGVPGTNPNDLSRETSLTEVYRTR